MLNSPAPLELSQVAQVETSAYAPKADVLEDYFVLQELMLSHTED